MSFTTRTNFSSPFGQITNSTDIAVNDRFDTVSVTWLSSSGSSGYTSANSKCFISAFISTSTGSNLFAMRLNGTSDRWKWGQCVNNTSVSSPASRAQNDDEFFDYSNTTEYDWYTLTYGAAANPQSAKSRFNLIRMEAT